VDSKRMVSNPETMGQERRAPRWKADYRLFFFGEDDFEGEATILDISAGGCQATSLTEVEAGMILKLSIFLDDQPWPLRIDQSIVRWVRDRTFGLEFLGIRPAQRERLRTLVVRSR